MANIYDKQHDKNNLKYLWASEYCSLQERRIIYFQIILSFLMPLISIFNKYLPILFPQVININNISEILSKVIVLISGCVIILQIFLNIGIKKWGKESVTLLEMYDIKVFNLFVNKAIMTSISYQNMLSYASKFKKKNSLNNYYFDTVEEAENKHAHFNAMKKHFENDYYYMLSFKSFLNMLWLGFIILLFTFAFAINPTWTETIMYIFIPSLSAIGIIAQTWNSFNVKIKFLENILHVVNEYSKKLDDISNAEGPGSRIAMRSLQDAMFLHRLDDFIIPNFILKKYQKRKSKENSIPIQAPILNKTETNCKNIYAQNTSKASYALNNQDVAAKSFMNVLKDYYEESRAAKRALKKETAAAVTEIPKNKKISGNKISTVIDKNTISKAGKKSEKIVLQKNKDTKGFASASSKKESKDSIKNTKIVKTVKPINKGKEIISNVNNAKDEKSLIVPIVQTASIKEDKKISRKKTSSVAISNNAEKNKQATSINNEKKSNEQKNINHKDKVVDKLSKEKISQTKDVKSAAVLLKSEKIVSKKTLQDKAFPINNIDKKSSDISNKVEKSAININPENTSILIKVKKANKIKSESEIKV